MFKKYRDYFNIDPEYLAQINEAEIESHPDLWKKFYPHDTFVKLIKDTISVISRKQKLSIWVEGAYGTGKSHAVLTLKKLLDATEDETKAYFDKYQDELGTDLYNKFQHIKSGDQKILTVHRYGSSNIYGDDDLVFAIQQSIVAALNKAGIKNHSEGALKDSAIEWLSNPTNKDYFNALIQKDYKDLLSGDDVDTIIKNLNKYSEQAMESPSKGGALQVLMSKIMKVAKEKHFSALSLSTTSLLKWIDEVIKQNNLKAILFIWDEFTDYFRKNQRAMTGFQEIADFSGDKPFYLMIVTHNVMHMFPEADKDWKRLMGRFVQPICNIELPENMAFRLMGNAMEENPDPAIQKEWHETRDDLYERTHDARDLVKKKAKITDSELKKVLPIHPYAALLLKHISSAFDSNQRSMFDFIKNDRGDEIKGFQWFINNCGPLDDNPFLTIDMLWDFFYEKGKEYLSTDIRNILDCYMFADSKNLDSDEKRVLKTVLLLEAISQRTGDSVELFIPNEQNLEYAFQGTELETSANSIANRMVPDILFKKPMFGGKTQYSALINSGNIVEIDKEKEKQKKKSTSALLQEADVKSTISLPGALNLRYEMRYVSYDDFKTTINKLRAQEDSFGNKIMAVTAFAKDDEESIQIDKAIRNAISDESYHIVFIDASKTPLGNDLLDQYAEAMANSVVNIKQDLGLAKQYEYNAKDALKKWRDKISSGEFMIFSKDKPEGERAATQEELIGYLSAINRKNYSEGLETHGSVNDTMWQSTSLALGAQCGANQKTSGQFRSGSEQTKLENYIGKEAWNVPAYWEKAPHLPISKIKIDAERIIKKAFASSDRISIAQIYDFFQDKNGKYGFMPCNLTAFVMGFVLKEYTDGTFNYSDGITTDILSVDKLKEMISEIIKNQQTPISRYKDKYIVTTTAEEKSFNEASSRIFGIPIQLCNTVEQTRERIRQQMKGLSFPIWVLKSILRNAKLQSSVDTVSSLIDYYCGIANNNNLGAVKTDSDIARDIGKLCLGNPGVIEDLAALVTKDGCTSGMIAYLDRYANGILPRLAKDVGDGGQYINRLKKKFDADAANWVWNVDTATQKIDEVILEYKIIVESNKILPKNVAFDATVGEWLDKCDMIKISYLYAKNYWEELSELMEILYNLKKVGSIADCSKREKFLEQIRTNGTAFNRFYNDQIPLFRKACEYIVGRFDDDEVREIYKRLPNNLFTTEKAEYQSTVQAVVEKYIGEQSTTKLKAIWQDKTGTDNPRLWSKKYGMPIQCMVPEKELMMARAAFDALNSKKPDAGSIDKAIDYLGKADFFEKLSDNAERDKAFRERIVKSYNVMLTDLDEVRAHLLKTVGTEPYDWYDSSMVENELKKMAEFKYNEIGCQQALAKIEDMDVGEVKEYLKRLIKDNMVVGMEIIKGK